MTQLCDTTRAKPVPGRIRRLRALLQALGCSHAVVAGADHVLHLSGYFRYLGAPAAVVVGPSGERTLVVARFELDAAEDEAEVDTVVGYGSRDLLDFAPMAALAAACGKLVPSSPIAVAGPPGFVSLLIQNSDTSDIDADLLSLRRVKDEDEIDRIRTSFELALLGQAAVEALVDAGRTEIELFTAGHAAAQEAAGAPVEFLGALASGSNTSLMAAPLHVPGFTRVPAGGPVLCDIAIRHRGYWGDSTRTFATDGETAPTTAVLGAVLNQAAEGLRPGRRVADVYAEMHAAITENLPGASFPHHGGHGIGIVVGEDPQIIPCEPSAVEEGMVFAIEPGAYWRGRHGARVENTYVVHRTGAVLISGAAGG
jgi:Xaa-Pro dipeptidase